MEWLVAQGLDGELLASLTDEEAAALAFDWQRWARPKQLQPFTQDWWSFCLVMAGRGFGKTRIGGERTRAWNTEMPGCIGALVGATPADVRDVMVEGPAGLLAVCPERERPQWEPSKRLLTFPLIADGTGNRPTVFHTYSAFEPGNLRGPQHHVAWADEAAKWKRAEHTWDMLQMGMRLEWPGKEPKTLVTTTPEPRQLIRELMKDPLTLVVRGSTYENAGNLAGSFLRKILAKYEGTRLGRQELHGEYLTDTPGALWQRAMFEREGFRVRDIPKEWALCVVGVDPAASDSKDRDGKEAEAEACEHGILVVCRVGSGRSARFYVLADLTQHGSPEEWGSAVVRAWAAWGANRVVAEANNGGEMVGAVLRLVPPPEGSEHGRVPVKLVHASKGKATRAEPVAMLYEQGRVHHVGHFPQLEDQLCTWVPGAGMPSPDRMDALVWAITALSAGGEFGYA